MDKSMQLLREDNGFLFVRDGEIIPPRSLLHTESVGFSVDRRSGGVFDHCGQRLFVNDKPTAPRNEIEAAMDIARSKAGASAFDLDTIHAMACAIVSAGEVAFNLVACDLATSGESF